MGKSKDIEASVPKQVARRFGILPDRVEEIGKLIDYYVYDMDSKSVADILASIVEDGSLTDKEIAYASFLLCTMQMINH